MINVSEEVKTLSHAIAVKAMKEAEYFPVDREFLNPYVIRIFQLNPVEFIFHNLERVNPTYTNILFLCLPEVWENIEVDDLLYMMNSFSNTFSYYTLIQFTYKYLEIDILQLIIKQAEKSEVYGAVREYLQNQWNVIIKSEYERVELEEGVEQEYFQYNANQWNYIKQKLLLDERVKPALTTYDGLEDYIWSIVE